MLSPLAMKVAIPIWNGRISPVFDVAKHLLVIEAADGTEVSRHEEDLRETSLGDRAKRIADAGLDVLICGAVSWPLEAMLVSAGVRVVPYRCGPVEDVLRAFAAGGLTERAFLMPGCCGRRRRFRGRCQGAGVPPGTLTERKPTMPNRDGTGPQGKGAGTGRGLGPCGGSRSTGLPAQGRATRGGGRRTGQGPGRAAGRGRRGRKDS